MDFLKEVLGEESFNNVVEKINTYNTTNPDKAIKIADLSSGKYVDSDKFASIKTKYEEANSKLEKIIKDGNTSEQLKSDLEKYKSDLIEANNKLTHHERKSVVSKVVDSEFEDFVVFEVTKLLDDKTDFNTSLNKFLEANPKYKKTTNRVIVSTGPKQNLGSAGASSSEFMNNAIRNSLKK